MIPDTLSQFGLMKMNKRGAKPGNQNAAKDGGATSYIQARCTPGDKARWVNSAQAEGVKLTEWIIKRLNA